MKEGSLKQSHDENSQSIKTNELTDIGINSKEI